jgi:hypothetical protein
MFGGMKAYSQKEWAFVFLHGLNHSVPQTQCSISKTVLGI